MNRFLKNVYVIIATLVLLLGAAFVATKESSAPPHFRVQNEFGEQNISIYDPCDGNYYVFLPSYANLQTVQAILPSDKIYYLDDIRLTDQMTCEVFELERPYHFTINGEDTGTFWFYQSQNVATMYLDTASGGMSQIHDDKNYEEYAAMTLYLPDGTLDYSDGISRLKGRGNSTWSQEKRPYLLKLSSEGDLLGMGSGKKWVLLANAYDETNLNNKLVFDLASQVGFSWSPDCEYVDLYLNGEYSGLYLLAEKIEVHADRLNIDSDYGDFLCKVDLPNKGDSLQYSFESGMGRIIEICDEDSLADENIERISGLVNRMEEEFCAEIDLTSSDVMDLDSWVRRYLIDEISGNIDSDLTSSYFYYSAGKFFAGPIWDYDMAFGNHYRNQEARSFIAKNAYKRRTQPSPYYSHLYSNESFYQRMVEIYRTEFLPILQKMISHDIDAQIQSISVAARMNSIRWQLAYERWKVKNMVFGVVQNADALKPYLIRRVEFLNSAWLENRDYCTVQFEAEPGDAYWGISVEKGTCLETTFMDLVDTVWVDMDTEEVVDFQQPITRDMVVKIETEEVIPPEQAPVEEVDEAAVPDQTETAEPEEKLVFLLFGCLLALLICLLLTDLSRKRNLGSGEKESRNTSFQQ